MRPQVIRLIAALASVAALSACQNPNVGERCKLSWGSGDPPSPQTASGDYFESGNIGCEDLICIVSPAPAGSKYGGCSGDSCGYCSKPCVSDQDCYKSETGLVCDQVVLDPAFLASLDETTRQRYLGETQYSSYCVVPRQ
ncbi:adventurous gliding motility lipoprotein CglC [Anaeromyxobacter dehalogenans]|uniref:Lipoprotein n=1 Tax=Anaeromyxobacter dehalogenans (strain 2CP-C) TaxID=290397 RepID=Q2IET4_ANADE|nr:adventurous gliding motility lipoprotein CglC [Anaeromyxobacter dehalogenans]ABC83093.1 hypothetical protein Adeh_3326 [Anaeromyxobacter dehalogenans 2CP-C]